MECPVCGEGTRRSYSTENFDGISVPVTIRTCKAKDCEFSWLPIEEERKISEVLEKSRPEIFIKYQKQDIDGLRTKLQQELKNVRDFEKSALEWKKAYGDLKNFTNIDKKHSEQYLNSLRDDLEQAKDIIVGLLGGASVLDDNNEAVKIAMKFVKRKEK